MKWNTLLDWVVGANVGQIVLPLRSFTLHLVPNETNAPQVHMNQNAGKLQYTQS